MIFTLFKPLDFKQQNFIDVPLFELITFVMHEINPKGLDSTMNGAKAIRYSDRYTIDNANYTDNTKKFIANMRANHGVYKNDILDLKGDVVYTREDGLTLETSKATYDKKSSMVNINQEYVTYKGLNRIVGSSAIYNNKKNRITSKNVVAKYQIREN